MQQSQPRKFTTFLLLAMFCSAALAAPMLTADKEESNKTEKAPAPTEKSGATTNEESGTAKAKTGKRRDPFFSPARYIPPPPPPPKPKLVKPEPKPIPAPPIERRVDEYKAHLRQFLNGSGQEPSKTSAYLIEELTVTGVFRTEEGFGAFLVETATKNQQTFFVRQGWQTFDGVIKEITPAGVRFIKTVRFDNGMVQQVDEFRPLPTIVR